ncbi:MAG: ABC transporter permease [Lachnospiraceae bacterium]|nr:ABC transporter permease [Lachnospiraceae bacterium]
MYRLFFIAKNNIKRQKGDMITFFIMTFITAFLIFDCASAFFGLGRVLDDRHKAINGADIMLFSYDTAAEKDSAEKAITEDEHIKAYEATPALNFITDYRKRGDDKFTDYEFYAEQIGLEKTIMKIGAPDIAYGKYDILLPYNLKTVFAVGDVMQLKFGDDIYDMRVAGYIEDPYFCTTMNITAYSVQLSEEAIDEFTRKYPDTVRKGWFHKGIADRSTFEKDYDTSNLEADIAGRYKESLSAYLEADPTKNYNNYLLANWDFMKGGSAFFPQIIMSLVIIFAVIILIISLVIVSFSIKNYIRRNMKATGILEASGYTVRELRTSLVLQITLVAALGAAAGITAGALTFDRFGNIVSSVLGLTWNQPADIAVAAVTFIGIVGAMALFSIRLSSAYRRFTVLDALRGGLGTHNYKKNFFPFDKTPLPVTAVMSLKDTFGGLGRNIAMVFISAILVIATLIGFGLVENFVLKPQSLLNMMAFEMGTDWIVQTTPGDIADELREVDGVDNVLTYIGFEPTISYNGKNKMNFCYAVDDMDNTRYTLLLEGRYPKTDNEILITGGIAGDLGAKVGDVVTVEYAGKEADYLVTGINQRMERMGRTIYMRIDGAKKLISGDISAGYNYYVTAKDGISYDEICRRIDAHIDGDRVKFKHSDIYSTMESTIQTVNMSLKAVCIVIIVLTVIIVAFVESLVIRTKISREWRSMGISKALGQTSGGMIVQIMLSNIPAILLGAVIGGFSAPAAGSGLVKAIFSMFAIKKIDFGVSPVNVLIAVAGIVTVALMTSAAAGLRVRKLRPVEMITEE